MRSRHSGTLRKDGRWQIQVTLTTATGQTVRKKLVAPTQREVQAKARELINKTNYVAYESHSIERLIDAYRIEYAPHHGKGTWRKHEPCYVRLIQYFGQRNIRDIESPQVMAWLKDMRDSKQVAGSTIQGYRNVLSSLFRFARSLGWVDLNPVEGLGLPPGVSAKPKPRPKLTHAAYVKILDSENDLVLRSLWMILGETAFRVSEALALRRDDLFTYQDVYFVRGGSKTDAGMNREAPIPDELAKEFLERETWLFPDLSKGSIERRSRSKARHAAEPGGPLLYNHVGEKWREVLAKAGLDPRINIHQLRKFASSRWIENGIPETVIKETIGHTDIRTTEKHYYRLSREELLRMVPKMLSGIGSMSKSMSNDSVLIPPMGMD